ncbi:MAG: sulfatase [Planctomycetes bacterium]|nr:sulfatase [Planctomycetota bacterium]
MRPRLAAVLGATFLVTACPRGAAEPPPSIVFFLADDLGWSDLGCMGSSYYETPNVDRLAGEGLRFSRAYTCGPNCAPTRACLLSGRYGPRHGIYTVGSGARGRAEHRRLEPVTNRTTLADAERTFAEVLRDAGYRTAHFGKWHLGESPTTQGFEVNAGGNHRGHPPSYFSPYRNSDLPDGPPGEHLTDRLTREALAFLDGVGDEPFLLYFPFYAVHTPLQAPADAIARFAEKTPSAIHGNATYAAMIEAMDRGIGRVLTHLERSGRAANTVVVFSSDNGGVGGYDMAGAKNITSNAPLRGGKGQLYEGGVRVPLIVRWPGVTTAGSTSGLPVNSVDFFPSFLEMAGVSVEDKVARDGVSFVPELRRPGSTPVGARALYWHFPGYLEANARRGTWRTTPAGSIVRGRHKLIEFFEDGRLELYDLEADVSERRDLSGEEPARVRELHTALIAWRRAVNAPMPTEK